MLEQKKSQFANKSLEVLLSKGPVEFLSKLRRYIIAEQQSASLSKIQALSQLSLKDLLISKAANKLKKDGYVFFWFKLPFYILQFIFTLLYKFLVSILLIGADKEIFLTNYMEIALETDWRHKPKPLDKQFVNLNHLTINWVIPTIGESGGYINIFRFVKFLSDKGHKVRVYEMSVGTLPRLSTSEFQRYVKKQFGDVGAEFFVGTKNMAPADATFATSWHTAYPVFEFPHTLIKLYLIQDFEPYFSPVGSESVLAENTYRFGFQGITAGRWLSEKLSKEYGMKCDYFNLSVDHKIYFNKNNKVRNKVFFYARPSTARRGFEIGIKALEIFAKRNPKFEILLAGQNLSDLKLDFPFTDLGYVSFAKLNSIYNECAVALIISLTNYSLLPLEIMATGCPVVTNFGENNEKNFPEGTAIYSHPSPFHIAKALEETVRGQGWIQISQRVTELAKKTNWEDQSIKLESVIKDSLKELGIGSLIDMRNTEWKKFEGKVLASVVIPTFNGERYIKELLDVLFKQKTDFKYEVIVIDSGSRDKTVGIIKKYPVRLIQIPNKEFNHGRTRNMGVKIAKGNYVAFLTQDAVPEAEHWLQRLVDAFYLDEKVGAVYGLQIPRENCDPMTKRDMINFFASMGPKDKHTVQYIYPGEARNSVNSLEFYSDVNSCIKKEVWKKVPYKELEYAEDQALGRDILKSGYKKVYEPRAAVIHSHSYPLFTYFQRQFDEYRGLKKAVGFIAKDSWWKVILGTLKGTSADINFILKQKYKLQEKIWWLNAALWTNLFRRTASYLAAKDNTLPGWAKEKLSLEFRQKKMRN